MIGIKFERYDFFPFKTVVLKITLLHFLEILILRKKFNKYSLLCQDIDQVLQICIKKKRHKKN